MYKTFFFGWLAGVLLTTITGPLGLFIIWRRMSSFGDTLSHSSLLGISFAVLLNIHPFFMVIITILLFGMLIIWLNYTTVLSLDTILGIIGYSFLSLGMIIINSISNFQKNKLTNYLFGNLLEVTYIDIVILIISCVSILFVLVWYWDLMLLTTINSDLAKIDGVNVLKINSILIFLITLTIGIAIKFIGSLIAISLLIIPAATAQRFSTSPEKMAFFSVIIGIISITWGILMSVYYNLAISPTIVFCSSIVFVISNLKKIL
ncbi:high-affinity zinc uptake system membrane protein ZnuB [Buchnera aphidicola str. Bp (Baizongia pistaciae)]|uniref:High-affinity zinc uptake system membrane protein ZnuB n=1 Tax=Buchnera aphidicola subsp. Baizongia pistaciae (strain Bp) TaxID=224915 RepID=ZNUB_BUCBP|nr:iron chelate uptake ABC transporter family permease subunit [Buchnera aphidicola]Q89AJ1.1 RecName: Full=High-affinity zinc uptake system membrane protein ZnuB [Buchnera aphidicola str. Bp (Baizongia pistaciae)]AAO27019.1 high-affinity zinc uptake system membrane protein ZnuB [Buchnera aphidicola str. Bp (Baizongia pistaciae)]